MKLGGRVGGGGHRMTYLLYIYFWNISIQPLTQPSCSAEGVEDLISVKLSKGFTLFYTRHKIASAS